MTPKIHTNGNYCPCGDINNTIDNNVKPSSIVTTTSSPSPSSSPSSSSPPSSSSSSSSSPLPSSPILNSYLAKTQSTNTQVANNNNNHHFHFNGNLDNFINTNFVTSSKSIADIDISNTDIRIFCNEDIRLANIIVFWLRRQGANNIRLCYPINNPHYANSTLIDAIKLPVYWDRHQIELGISNAVIIISMFYNDFANQETLLNACICKGVALFITWDSGMELETYVKDKQCPRTRLHKKLLEYKNLTANQPDHMYWILFQVGIFDEEILRHDVSTITTAFNNPKQSIFLNITVKDELAQLVVEAIISKKLLADRNYVIGDFVSHTYLGHVYQVVNHGALFDENMPAEIGEFETSNKLRLSGIVSARPLPRILYPGCSIFFHNLGIEISFQHEAIIYKLLNHHKRIPLKDWVRDYIRQKQENL